MEANIISKIESILGVNDALPKIDPNTQAPANNQSVSIDDAAVPAMLAGLYKKTRSEAGANDLITRNGNSIFEIILGDQKDNVAKSVASYAGTNETEAYTEMQHIADVTRLCIGYFKATKCRILNELFYNPAHKNTYPFAAGFEDGELLNDSTIDDKTNKMEGPMSGLMHGIEKIFSSSK